MNWKIYSGTSPVVFIIAADLIAIMIIWQGLITYN